MIGATFIGLVVVLGDGILTVLHLLPMAVLGVLLLFAGVQLAMTLLDLQSRKDLFVSLLILGLTLAANLAVGFMTGIVAAYVLKSDKLQV
jgi:SulP family sulfate permease